MKNIQIGLVFVFFCFSVCAQEEQIQNIDIDNVTNSQLEKSIEKAESKGYTQSQIEQMARLKGMSSVDISKLRARIIELKNAKTETSDYIDVNVLREDFPGLDLGDEEMQDIVSNSKQDSPVNKSVFGMRIFGNRKLIFEPNLNIPTPIGYKLGAGDQLIIDVWGASEKTYQLTINAEGVVKIPKLGPVYLSGLSIEDASEKLISRLSKIYEGLIGRNNNTYAQISLSSIRSITVNVIGEVVNPGTYTLSSLSKIYHVLYAAGGATAVGNLRGITLYRNNEKYEIMDVYDFLLNGNLENNIRVEDGDIVHVGVFQKRVEIKGEVTRPMMYDLKGDENLSELIGFAQGLTLDAYPRIITVNRRTENGRKLLTFIDKEISEIHLENGDEVKIASAFNSFENRVEISGAVVRPGAYQLREGMTLKSLLQEAEGVTGDAFLERGHLRRLNSDYSYRNISFNLSNILNGTDLDINLKSEDNVVIKSRSSLKNQEYVSIKGAVRNPKQIVFDHNLSIEDVIFKAGGFEESAIRNKVEISRRVNPDSNLNVDRKAEVFYVDINRELGQTGASEFILNPFDLIIVRESPVYETQQSVYISGNVFQPGYHPIERRSESVSDFLRKAGGVTGFADINAAYLVRNGNKINLELSKVIENPKSKYDLYIERDDLLHFPSLDQTVKIKGSVFRGDIVTRYDDGTSFKSFIATAGGFSDEANRRKSYVIDVNGEASRTKSFLFIKRYPKVNAGSVIVVPEKVRREKLSAQAWIAFASSMMTLAIGMDRLLN